MGPGLEGPVKGVGEPLYRRRKGTPRKVRRSPPRQKTRPTPVETGPGRDVPEVGPHRPPGKGSRTSEWGRETNIFSGSLMSLKLVLKDLLFRAERMSLFLE